MSEIQVHKYGPHLLMDIVGCNPKKIMDGAFLYDFMQRLTKKIGMNPIGGPHMDLYSGPHPEWQGFSISQHVQTSHLSFHFFAFGYVFADIFSCKDFDVEEAFNFIKEELEADQHEASVDHLNEKHIKALEFLKDKKSVYKLISRGETNFPPSFCD